MTPWGNVPKCPSLFDTLVPKLHEFQLVDAKLSSYLKERMCMCLNAYSSPVNSFARDSFLYYVFAYDDFHASFDLFYVEVGSLLVWPCVCMRMLYGFYGL